MIKNDEMGFSLNPLEWFSSENKTFTKSQNISAGYTWLQQVYNELKPNATYAQFIIALKQDSYGTLVDDEYFNDSFMDSVGFAYNTSRAISDKVKASLVKTLSVNKNMLPTRRDISSAFLNPDTVKWTYWDAVKVTSSQAYQTASTVASAVGTGFSVGAFIMKYSSYFIGAGVIGLGYFLYQNSDELKSRVKEKGFKAIGLGKNPRSKKRSRK